MVCFWVVGQLQTGIEATYGTSGLFPTSRKQCRKGFEPTLQIYLVNIRKIETHITSSKHYPQTLQSHEGIAANTFRALQLIFLFFHFL